MQKLALSVHLGTNLNRTHLLVDKETFILPCLRRTELDIQASGHQSIMVEDSISMVLTSSGKLNPSFEFLCSEPAIVAGVYSPSCIIPDSKVSLLELIADYSIIRDLIEKTFQALITTMHASLYQADSACHCRRPNAQWPIPTR